MGNSSFGKLESKQNRKQRIMESTLEAQQKLKNMTEPSTQLMINSQIEKTKQVLVNIMQTQLIRSGRPFTKADLISILLYFSILRKENKNLNVQLRNMTNEELRSTIRNRVYSSSETISALKQFSSIPMASVSSK